MSTRLRQKYSPAAIPLSEQSTSPKLNTSTSPDASSSAAMKRPYPSSLSRSPLNCGQYAFSPVVYSPTLAFLFSVFIVVFLSRNSPAPDGYLTSDSSMQST